MYRVKAENYLNSFKRVCFSKSRWRHKQITQELVMFDTVCLWMNIYSVGSKHIQYSKEHYLLGKKQTNKKQHARERYNYLIVLDFCFQRSKKELKPVLNSAKHTSDSSTNYDSFLNQLNFSSSNMVRRNLLRSQLACNEMQASARTCGRRAADSMIENAG